MIVSMIHGVVGEIYDVCVCKEKSEYGEKQQRQNAERKKMFFTWRKTTFLSLFEKFFFLFYGTFELTESDGGTTKHSDD